MTDQNNNGADAAADQKKEDKAIESLEENMLEMRSAMLSMMSSGTKTMQAFVDMRMNYLKVMREGLEDPVTMMNIMSKNLADTAKSLKDERRKEDDKEAAANTTQNGGKTG